MSTLCLAGFVNAAVSVKMWIRLVEQAEQPCHALFVQAGVHLNKLLTVLHGFLLYLGKGVTHFVRIEHVRGSWYCLFQNRRSRSASLVVGGGRRGGRGAFCPVYGQQNRGYNP